MLSQKDVSEMLNVSIPTTNAYKNRGIPMTDDKPAKYPAREVMFWAIQNQIVDFNIKVDDDDLEDLPPSIRKDLADARLKEHKLKELQGEVISIEEIRKENEYILTAFRNKTLGVPSKIAPALIGIESVAEIKAILEEAMYELLTELSRLENV